MAEEGRKREREEVDSRERESVGERDVGATTKKKKKSEEGVNNNEGGDDNNKPTSAMRIRARLDKFKATIKNTATTVAASLLPAKKQESPQKTVSKNKNSGDSVEKRKRRKKKGLGVVEQKEQEEESEESKKLRENVVEKFVEFFVGKEEEEGKGIYASDLGLFYNSLADSRPSTASGKVGAEEDKTSPEAEFARAMFKGKLDVLEETTLGKFIAKDDGKATKIFRKKETSEKEKLEVVLSELRKFMENLVEVDSRTCLPVSKLNQFYQETSEKIYAKDLLQKNISSLFEISDGRFSSQYDGSISSYFIIRNEISQPPIQEQLAEPENGDEEEKEPSEEVVDTNGGAWPAFPTLSDDVYGAKEGELPTSDSGSKIRALLATTRGSTQRQPKPDDNDKDGFIILRSPTPTASPTLSFQTENEEVKELRLSAAEESEELLPKEGRFLAPSDLQAECKYFAPWLAGFDLNCPSPRILLHNEILRFASFVSPLPSEERARKQAGKIISDLAKELWPDSETVVFGSSATNLALPLSDVDVVIFSEYEVGPAINKFSQFIRKRNITQDMVVLRHARVPIIKLHLIKPDVHIDICFNQQGGPRTAKLIREMTQEMRELRPLTLVIKYYLAQRRLNDTSQGGVGSFLTFLLTWSIVQNARKEQAQQVAVQSRHRFQDIKNKSAKIPATYKVSPLDLGTLLLRFLDMYGRQLNYQNVTICLRDGGSYETKSERRWNIGDKPNLLSVENPDDTNADVGRNSYGISQIRHSFSHGYRCLTDRFQEFHEQGSRSTSEASSSSSSKHNRASSAKKKYFGSILTSFISLDAALKDRASSSGS